MEPDHEDASPTSRTVEDTIEEFLNSGTKSGNYKSNLRSALKRWNKWLSGEGIRDLDNVDKHVMAEYTKEELHKKTLAANDPTDDEDGFTAATAWTYFDYISAFLDYCVEWDYKANNPAQKGGVKNNLPDRPTSDSSAQQFWSPADRKALLAHVDEQAAEAIEEDGLEAITVLRDRALAYILAYSGVRGGEVLSDPRDDRRIGLRWEHVEIEDNRLTVFGKDQQWEPAQLPKQTHQSLRQLRRALDPPDEDWPVFPTNHAPSLHAALPDSWERPDDDERSLLDHCRTQGATPPALSTNGGRNVLKRICQEADLDIDGDYLKPHGGRRGAGETLYRELDAAAAQRALRHNDPATTSKMYSHIDASELAEDTSEAFETD